MVALILVRVVVTLSLCVEGVDLRRLPSMFSFSVRRVGRIVVSVCGLTLRRLTLCHDV